MVATGEIRGIFGLSMKSYTSVVICTLFLAFVLPVFVSAQTESAGPKPGTFFYLVDTTFEKVGLFFTFNAEKKARKALGYADKRLAEIEAIDETEKPEVLKKLIANYEDNIALAVEKSKKVTDKEKAEDLFTSIAENTSKNEEVLSAVLIKVPEEAKEAIMQAIESSRKNNEEATKQITELKKEVEELKTEIQSLKEELEKKEEKKKFEDISKDEEKNEQKEIEELKKDIEKLEKEIKQPETKNETGGNKTATLPNGSVVEMDKNGNILRYINESQSSVSVAPPQNFLEITSVYISPGEHSAKIEWRTNVPTDSKIFFTEMGSSIRVIASKSGNSTRHLADITNLSLATQYKYEIEAVTGLEAKRIIGDFQTSPQTFIPKATANPDDAVPFLEFSSNGTIKIKRLVFIHDDSYCVGGYLGDVVSGLNLQYASGGNEVQKDSEGRIAIDFPEPGLSAKSFRISALTHGQQSSLCINAGTKFTLLGSESIIINEIGQKITFQDVILFGQK